MSVIDCEVTSFALRRSALSFFHHTESATTTPTRALSPTRALAVKEPRSLKMRTVSPSPMPRAPASAGWMSRLGPSASASANGRLAKDELRKWRVGGGGRGGGKFFLLGRGGLSGPPPPREDLPRALRPPPP